MKKIDDGSISYISDLGYAFFDSEIKLEEAAVLHYTYTKFSDLTSRRDRCGCKPTKEDVKRCFMLEFDRAVSVAYWSISFKIYSNSYYWYSLMFILIFWDPCTVLILLIFYLFQFKLLLEAFRVFYLRLFGAMCPKNNPGQVWVVACIWGVHLNVWVIWCVHHWWSMCFSQTSY